MRDPTPSDLHFRDAHPEDAATLHALLVEFAAHEGTPDRMRSTPAQLHQGLAKGLFHAVLVEGAGGAVGFATYTLDYMAWFGSQVLRLDDLYVQPQQRGAGLGVGFMRALAGRALERGIAMRWEMQKGNASARGFYEHLGAESDERTVWRWLPDAMARFTAAR